MHALHTHLYHTTATAAIVAPAAALAEAVHATDEVLHRLSSPFANLHQGHGSSLPLGWVERQGRRQEYSGSLPLEQMFSRVPSPIASASDFDRQSSDGLASQASSRRTSRLGSSTDPNQLMSAASRVDVSSTGTEASSTPQDSMYARRKRFAKEARSV